MAGTMNKTNEHLRDSFEPSIYVSGVRLLYISVLSLLRRGAITGVFFGYTFICILSRLTPELLPLH